MDAQPSAALQFPNAPKLELDVLIDQLVDRARDVQHSQGRLRALLRAIETVFSDPGLEATLLNVVTAACGLADATYGALGVIGVAEGLTTFITVGMTPDEVDAVGAPPQGRGLLGALIHEPAPIRLGRLADDSRSTGFPAGHPDMTSFLGVPVRVSGDLFCNLYLTDGRSGDFTAEDEELVCALALAAGTAISNARLLQESGLQQRWLAASVDIGAQLLADDGNDPLDVIARRAIELADADLVVVTLLGDDSHDLVVAAASGSGSADLIGRVFTIADSPVRTVVELGTSLLVATVERVVADDSMPTLPGPLMALPLTGTEGLRGVLSFARTLGRQPFSTVDLAMAGSFAGHASIALELADARSIRDQLARVEDRDRIARDLHDHVIQELFAIGLGLETTTRFVEPDGVAEQRIVKGVREIDRTIRRIRTSIFELRGPLDASTGGVRRQILQIAAELAEALGFAPQVTFSGLVDTAVSATLADDVYASLREMLTNIAKHAHATRSDVDLSVSATDLNLSVIDDGVGYTGGGRRSGLANLRVRAEQHGGSFDVSPAEPGGTACTWKALL